MRWIALGAAAALFATASAAATAGRDQYEQLPDVTYGTAAVPPGARRITVTRRFITAASRVYLTVDTTPDPDLAVSPLPGLKVVSAADGLMAVETLDGSIAPASGVPFTYVIVNEDHVGPTTAGTAILPSGARSVRVTAPGAAASSHVMVSIDLSGTAKPEAPRAGLRVLSTGPGSFEVGTLDGAAAPAETRFHWLLNSGNDCLVACSAKLPGGTAARAETRAGLPPQAVVLVASRGASALGIHTHGLNAFEVTTLSRQGAVGDTPYDFFVFLPPHRWEEFGPTASSGNAWTTVADPALPDTRYAGSLSGVWKTTDGGDAWYRAWNLPTTSIVRLAMARGQPKELWAMASDGSVYRTQDSGRTWTVSTALPGATGVVGSAGFVSPAAGRLIACDRHGLFQLDAAAGSGWQAITVSGAGVDCSDVIETSDGRFLAAFRRATDPATRKTVGGIFLRGAAEGSAWSQVMSPPPSDLVAPECTGSDACGPRAIRVAAAGNRVVANIDCMVFLAPLDQLAAASGVSRADRQWQQAQRAPGGGAAALLAFGSFVVNKSMRVCAAVQSGYAMSVAVSPASQDVIVAAGSDPWLTTDGGKTWSQLSTLAGDDHEVRFLTGDLAIAATDGGYSQYSTDGGRTWKRTRNNAGFSDGAPIAELYNLTVSQADAFGRALLGGNVQDLGGRFMLGRPAGFFCCGGELGMTEAAQHLDTVTSAVKIGGRKVATRATRAYAYGTAFSAPKVLIACRYDVPGPDYGVPDGVAGEGNAINAQATCANSPALPANITALATSRQSGRSLLVGAGDGSVSKPDPADTNAADGLSLLQVRAPDQDEVNTIFFASDADAYLGTVGGKIVHVRDPFGAKPSLAAVAGPPALGAVVGFAAVYGNAGAGLYVAEAKRLWLTRNPDAAAPFWEDVSGGAADPLRANLALGVNVVGIARDETGPQVYVATGRNKDTSSPGNWRSAGVSRGAVFVARHSSLGTAFAGWTRYTEGMPDGLPITGLGLAAGHALFVSTQGYGAWWRRDLPQVVSCGHRAQPCCEGVTCGRQLTCARGACTCGGPGQPCCSPAGCNAGLSCVNLVCVSQNNPCNACQTALNTCLSRCGPDANCKCLCQESRCGCFMDRGCGPCVFPTCHVP